jgi:hypothetical protein
MLNSPETFVTWNIQGVVSNYTNTFYILFWEPIREFNFVVRLNADFAFSTLQDKLHLNFTHKELASNVGKLASELYFIGKPQTLAETLNEVVPSDDYFWELFEVMSVNIDNSLYSHLHLPPFKLHYPEPYIASPSFVHEEL